MDCLKISSNYNRIYIELWEIENWNRYIERNEDLQLLRKYIIIHNYINKGYFSLYQYLMFQQQYGQSNNIDFIRLKYQILKRKISRRH